MDFLGRDAEQRAGHSDFIGGPVALVVQLQAQDTIRKIETGQTHFRREICLRYELFTNPAAQLGIVEKHLVPPFTWVLLRNLNAAIVAALLSFVNSDFEISK
jgi:hypothetical protein